jgi:hypothetical protein
VRACAISEGTFMADSELLDSDILTSINLLLRCFDLQTAKDGEQPKDPSGRSRRKRPIIDIEDGRVVRPVILDPNADAFSRDVVNGVSHYLELNHLRRTRERLRDFAKAHPDIKRMLAKRRHLTWADAALEWMEGQLKTTEHPTAIQEISNPDIDDFFDAAEAKKSEATQVSWFPRRTPAAAAQLRETGAHNPVSPKPETRVAKSHSTKIKVIPLPRPSRRK